MGLKKLTSTDGFVVRDFDDAPSTGVVRCGKKILQSSAKDLARSATYAFATFGIERGGASAGVNAQGEAVPEALAAAATELAPMAGSGDLHLHPGKGVAEGTLAALDDAAGQTGLAGSSRATIASIVAAASWALGGSIDGHTVAIEQSRAAQAPAGLANALTAAGARIVDVDGVDEKPWLIWGADVDVVLAGSKPGTLNHQGADSVRARALVPWGPIPYTTKAVATLLKKGDTIVVPDFAAASGGLIAGYLPGDEGDVLRSVASGVWAALSEAAESDDGVLMGSCYRAEAFLASWRPKLPFGRPLAA